MAIKGLNRVFLTTSSTGSGQPFVCSATAAATGYRTLAQEATDGATYYYARWDQTSGSYEEGYGVLTLATRTITPTGSPLRSSNGVGTPVNWSGTQNVIFALGQGSLMGAQNALEEIALLGLEATARANIDAEFAFASGTKWPFAQAAAPTGWTQDTASGLNDAAALFTNGSGGGTTGGSWTLAGVTIGSTSLTVANLPEHHHPAFKKTFTNPLDTMQVGPTKTFVQDVSDGNDGSYTAWNTGDTGSGTGHTHSFTSDATWRPRYFKMIVCSKN